MNDERALYLVRLRLLVRGKQPIGKIADSLLPFVDDGSRWRERFESLLDRLAADGELDRATLALTQKGRERALSSIGLRALPPRANWRTIVRAYVVPSALGIADPRGKERVARADGLRAALLAQQGAPTLNEAIDALVWRTLEMPEGGRLTLKKLRERVLSRALGDQRTIPLDRAVRVAAAKAAGARRTEADALAEAVIRRWVSGSGEARTDDSSRADITTFQQSLERFAAEVLAAARDPQTKRFTGEKAFIDSIFARIRANHGELDAKEFKARLIEAHRRGLVVLSRADLTQLADPHDLAASEIHLDGASFHFVRTDLPETSL
jgi:hypothetical protein